MILSVAVLFGRHGDELLGRLGDVVGALDDLLSDQLQVGRGGAVERGLLALSVEPAGAGGQQAERPAHRLRPRRLPGGRGVERNTTQGQTHRRWGQIH